MSGDGIQLGMALGEKLFEESGNVTGFKVTRVPPIEGGASCKALTTTAPSGRSDLIKKDNQPICRQNFRKLQSLISEDFPYSLLCFVACHWR
jgi:hypothetical protein